MASKHDGGSVTTTRRTTVTYGTRRLQQEDAMRSAGSSQGGWKEQSGSEANSRTTTPPSGTEGRQLKTLKKIDRDTTLKTYAVRGAPADTRPTRASPETKRKHAIAFASTRRPDATGSSLRSIARPPAKSPRTTDRSTVTAAADAYDAYDFDDEPPVPKTVAPIRKSPKRIVKPKAPQKERPKQLPRQLSGEVLEEMSKELPKVRPRAAPRARSKGIPQDTPKSTAPEIMEDATAVLSKPSPRGRSRDKSREIPIQIPEEAREGDSASSSMVRKGVHRQRTISEMFPGPAPKGKSSPETPVKPRLEEFPGPAPKRKLSPETPVKSRPEIVPDPTPKRKLSPEETVKPRRTRLIDRLAAQSTGDSDSDASDSDETPARPISREPPDTPRSRQAAAIISRDARARPVLRPGDSAIGRRIKNTYSQGRSIRGETQSQASLGPGGLESGPGDIDDNLLFGESLLPPSPTRQSPDSFGLPGDDGDGLDSQPEFAIKSVHELKRAGANHRFADEMDDLLSRIGSAGAAPSSMRRNALLDLAQKLQGDAFAKQFRDHATRDTVVKAIGKEEDIISGFALAASLVVFLSAGPAPNLLRQLAEDGVGRLLGRLLRVGQDIESLAKERKMNLSMASRGSLRNIKKQFQTMRIWHGYTIKDLAPLRIALQLLDIVVRLLDVHHLEGVMSDIQDDLIEIAEQQTEDPDASENVDFWLIAHVLEAESSVSGLMDDGSAASSRRPFAVSQFLQTALGHWPSQRADLDSAILKLSINTTNTSAGASVFDNQNLLSNLASCIAKGFRVVQSAITTKSLKDETYDSFVLILGVMINIFEKCPSARRSLDEEAMDILIGLFLDNHRSISEADSVESSKLSVAFGYLAVLLGYLSLGAPVQGRMEGRDATQRGKSLLVDTIREFIAMFRSVDSKVQGLEELVQEIRVQRK